MYIKPQYIMKPLKPMSETDIWVNWNPCVD